MSFGYQVLGFGAFPNREGGYTVENAIMLDGSSDYLNKTFSGTGTNRKKFTFSCWFKLASVSTTQTLLSCDDTGSDKEFMFWVQSDGTIRIANYEGGTNKLNLITERVLRDPTAWYHLILSANTDGVTPSVSTIKLYLNGVQIPDADLSTNTYPLQDFEFALGNSFDHEVGRYALSNNNLWNGYIAEMVFVDGDNLAYTDFGEFDNNGVWVPIKPPTSLGTNGFHLKFDDATDLGKDASATVNDSDFYENIQAGSLTSNLQLVLDAGDSSSYSSGQKWLDLSGNGYDFHLGAGSSASSDDPTFNGSAGGLSRNNYFSFDGGDVFTYDSSNETWMDNLHKNNATFTIAGWFYTSTTNDDHVLFGTGAATTGIVVKAHGDGTVRINVYNGSSSELEITTSDAMSDEAYHFFALSLDEAGGSSGSFFYLDGDYMQVSSADTFNGAYSSPSSDAASTMEIGGRPGSGSPDELLSGDRIAGFMAWSTNLSKANLDTLYASTKVRFSGNHWSPTSLAAANKVTDTCTDDSENNIGNYPTWSPIDKDSNVSLSLGNTVAEQDSASSWKAVFATKAIPSTGKWVWETKLHGTDPFGGWLAVGVASSNALTSVIRGSSGTIMFDFRDDGSPTNNLRWFNQTDADESLPGTSGGISFSNGEAFQFLVDSDDEELMLYINGSKQGNTVDISGLTKPYKILATIYSGGSADCTLVTNSANFENSIGVSGYKTLNTANLPAPTVKNPDNGFALITLEDGDTIEASLATARTGWGSFIDVFKREDGTDEDYDVRFSDDSGNSMHFNTNAAAGSEATLASSVNYSAWSWRVGATYGCYTAEISHTNGSATNQAHSLGSGAKTAIAKRSDSTGDWYVSHPNMSSANIRFNVQDRPSTSELVTVDGTNITLNSSFATGTYRVIVWEQIEGFSAFTGYSHNGSTTDGPYVNLGGSASLVAWRNIDSSNSNDFFPTFTTYSTNGNGNPTDIRYNWSNGEKGSSGITIGDVTANGYKMRPSAGGAFGIGSDDPMLVWAWGIRPFGGENVAQARAR